MAGRLSHVLCFENEGEDDIQGQSQAASTEEEGLGNSICNGMNIAGKQINISLPITQKQLG
jgi:hypothetical protein